MIGVIATGMEGKKGKRGCWVMLGGVAIGFLCVAVLSASFSTKKGKKKNVHQGSRIKEIFRKIDRPERLSTTLESGRERVQFTWWLIGDRV